MNTINELFYITEEGTLNPKGIIKEGKDLRTKYFETRERIAVSCIWEPGYRERRNSVEEIIVPIGVRKLARRYFRTVGTYQILFSTEQMMNGTR